VIFLDSWVWLEFLLNGDREEAAFAVIERADTAAEGGLVTSLVLSEVGYRMRAEIGETAGREAVATIQSHEHVESVPVDDDIATDAAELRHDYYQRRECELSYADAIHLAAAAADSDCDTLYTGDGDFSRVDEVETVVL